MARSHGNVLKSESFLRLPKYFDEDIIMVTSGSLNQYSTFSGAPLFNYKNDESIVGLGLRFKTTRMPGYEKHSFGLTMREGNDLHFLVDLCIYPNHIKSHADRERRENIFGSHIHIIDETHKLNINYDTTSWTDWFKIFSGEANIDFRSTKIILPFEGELI